MAMTPIMSLLKRAVRDTNVSRRAFLTSTASAALVVACSKPSKILSPDARIAIVGAGIAGLHCAWTLQQHGMRADVYEASTRTGGRILTGRDIIGPGSVTELGGEFIDSSHKDMLTLAQTFGLELIDLRDASTSQYHDAFFFDGRLYTERDITAAIKPFIPRFAADIAVLPRSFMNLAGTKGEALDAMSLDAYFHACGIDGWVRSFLETAFVTENGLDLEEQSALNFLSVIAYDIQGNPFRWFGDSDERYRVKNGNEQIVGHLAAAVHASMHTGHVLESVRKRGSSFTLSFRADATSKEVTADHVVFALPFSMLRNVELDVDLPAVKRQAIQEARYSSNAKIVVGFDTPFWLLHGNSGTVYSDTPVQLAWDNTERQGIQQGGLTFFSGGANTRLLWENGITKAIASLTSALQPIWKDIPLHPTKINGFNWPDYPWSKGAYSTYTPGQWTKFYGREQQAVGALHFAGEHCSKQGKGYMNGAAETGRMAATEILRAYGHA